MTELTFKQSFMYPFHRAKGLLNILWILLPIFGWFALIGYGVRIVQEFVQGKFQELPVMKFKENMKLGFWMFLKAIPLFLSYFVIVAILSAISQDLGSFVSFLIELFVLPILVINFFVQQTVQSSFDFSKVSLVFSNFLDYIVAVLKTLLLAIIFLVMWIVLVGIPAGSFTQYIFLADFYRRKTGMKSSQAKAVKKSSKKASTKKASKTSTKKKVTKKKSTKKATSKK